MHYLFDAFVALAAPVPMFLIFLGVFLGITIGAIPGLTGSMLIALTLPLTFYMKSGNALTLLVSMYIGAVSGGLITATILRIPGTPSSVVTTFDGYPMAQQGKAGRAIGVGIISSFIGGLVAWIFLATLSPFMAKFALKFSSYELTTLVLMALVLIAAVGDGSVIKALASGFLGLLAAVPGMDPISGTVRMTFGFDELMAGFNLLPVLIGLFGINQIISDVIGIEVKITSLKLSLRGMLLSLKELKLHGFNLLRSSLIGTWIGILPGVGASTGSIIAYWAAKNASKHPELFGKGSEEGIVASEAANNATVNGALIPLLTMGIPGSVITAILLGALVLHDLNPGPLLFTSDPAIIYGIMASSFVANIVMLILMLVLSVFVARLTDIPKSFLIPIIVTFCIIGSFSLNNRYFDVWVMILFGIIGFFLEKASVPLAPFIIGFILNPIFEVNLRSSLMNSNGSFVPFFTHPISLVFILISIAIAGWIIYSTLKSKKINSLKD